MRPRLVRACSYKTSCGAPALPVAYAICERERLRPAVSLVISLSSEYYQSVYAATGERTNAGDGYGPIRMLARQEACAGAPRGRELPPSNVPDQRRGAKQWVRDHYAGRKSTNSDSLPLMNRQRLLITGGAGFIGSALVRRAVREGHTVLNLDKLTYASSLDALAEVEAAPEYCFVQGDVADVTAVREAITALSPDAIVHLAAESHVDRSIDGPAAFIHSNVVGTFILLEEARRYWNALPEDRARSFRFVQVSTDEVFGSLGDVGQFDESSRYDPSSPYSASKAAGDHLARAWHRTYGLPVIVTNCSNNYGPFQFPEKLIPLAIERGVAGAPIPVYGTGLNVRDWIHVDDHAAGLLSAVARGVPGATYLFGARSERTNLDVVRAICAALDALRPGAAPHERIEFVTDRPGHDVRYAIDPSFAEQQLGWTAQHRFDEGIADTVGWYLATRDWADSIRDHRYCGHRLGAAAAT